MRFLALFLAALFCFSCFALVGCEFAEQTETTAPAGNENENTAPKGDEETTAPAGEENTDPAGDETTAPAGNETTAPDTPEVKEEGYDGSEITITFYHTMGQNLRDVLDAYIVEFNKLYPNITIVHEQVGGYDDVREQISTEITVGNQPNIAYCYPDHVAMYNISKAVVPLDSLIASMAEVTLPDGTTERMGLTDRQIKDFIPGYYNEGKEFGDGKMYTLPLSKSTEVLYYRSEEHTSELQSL